VYWHGWTKDEGSVWGFVPFAVSEAELKDNSRYIGRVVGVVNPL